jgi:hypothetical protein
VSAKRKIHSRGEIHLVATAKAPRHPNTRLTLGDYIADVLISRTDDVCYHYIVQRIGSAEIIDMQKFGSFAEAEQAAKEALQSCYLRDQEQAS